MSTPAPTHSRDRRPAPNAAVEVLLFISIFAALFCFSTALLGSAREQGEELRERQQQAQALADDVADRTRDLAAGSQTAPAAAPAQDPAATETHDPDRAPEGGGGVPAAALVAASLVALGAVGTGGTLAGRHLLRGRRDRHQLLAAHRRRWDQARADHDLVADQYADLRLDPIAAIDHLALWEAGEPLTEKFTLAYAHCVDLRSALTGGRDDIDADTLPTARVAEYAAAVTEARTHWDAARRHAGRRGTQILPPTERAAAARARKLLLTAANPAATTAERALAARRAADLLDSLHTVCLPDQTRTELEHLAARELQPSTA